MRTGDRALLGSGARHRLLALFIGLVVAQGATAQNLSELWLRSSEAGAKADAQPADYKADWQAAAAYRDYAEKVIAEASAGWKDVARNASAKAAAYGAKAAALRAQGVEGWYWQGAALSTYAKCIGWLQAVKEGTQGKIQMALEMAYTLDRTYSAGAPIVALGEYWFTLPGVAGRSVSAAEKLFDEYIGLYGNEPKAASAAWYNRGQLYRETGREREALLDFAKAAALGNERAAAVLSQR